MRVETSKILGRDIPLVATCVRVPVRAGHAEAVFCEFERPIDPDQARAALAAFPGVCLRDDPDAGVYATPLHAVERDATFVSRLRADATIPDGRGLAFWVVADNRRKGAALNAVQIAETALAHGTLTPRAARADADDGAAAAAG